MSYIYDLLDTWNDGATTFTAVKMNVTDTASNASSLLMDLQIGSSSRFNVGKTGSLKLGVSPTGTNQAGTNVTISGSQGTGNAAGGSIIFQVAPLGSSGSAQNALTAALTIGGDKNVTFSGNISSARVDAAFIVSGAALVNNDVISPSNGQICFTSALWFGTADVILRRDAANTLALRNSTAAQAFNIYNTYTSSTSFERYSVDWITTANLVIVGPNKGSVGGTQRVQRLAYLEDGGAGSTVPLLGSTCPAASGTVKSWIKVITSDGTTAYVPCWA